MPRGSSACVPGDAWAQAASCHDRPRRHKYTTKRDTMSKRPLSRIARGWWDYTTLDRDLLDAAAALTAEDLLRLRRPGFSVRFYETLEDFYLAEALEYITAWRQATPARPAGICGPIGPTEQLPLVARLVNELEIDLRYCHFWGMDE